MKPEIFYFSGTGNSIVVAREISIKLDGALSSISSTINQDKVKIDSDTIGLVFPCYLAQLYGLPLITEKFIKKIEAIQDKYLFAVCTYGGFGPVNAIPTLNSLKKCVEICGGEMAYGFSIKLPLNNLDYEHIPIPINRDQVKMFLKCDKTIEKIVRKVSKRARKPDNFVGIVSDLYSKALQKILGKYVLESLKKHAHIIGSNDKGFRELIPLTDKSILLNDKCNGCGICSKICPVENILIIDSKPNWQHRCEMCFACDEWCPQGAIHHWAKIEGKDYHHPKVNLKDMLIQRETK